MKRFAIAMSLAATLLASSAHAGKDVIDTVVVVPGGASGSITDARIYGGAKEFIDCRLMNATSGGDPLVPNFNAVGISCGARDSAGNEYGCNAIGSQAMRDIVAGLNSTSWVYFWGDGSGNCLGIMTHHGSYYL